MSFGWLLEAHYQDGFVLREQPEDQNPFGPDGNTYTAILNHQPAEYHGPLVRFAIVPEGGGEARFIDWTVMPEGTEPIYYRKMSAAMVMGGGGGGTVECLTTGFGYRCPDGTEEIVELS